MSAKASLFPSDEVIYERSKEWSNFMARMVKEENYKCLHYDEIRSDDDEDDSESEAKENSPDNDNLALVKVDNFEGSSTSDEFDVDDLLNETLPVIEERKRKWKESGMDRVLDTFDVNAITDKVGSWLRKSKLQKCMPINSSVEEEQIMHFENHQVHFNSDESLQSADTAKYILSNRKPRATSCTTMTIKRFRYVKGKQKELERKYNNFDKFDVNHELNEVFSKKCIGRLPAIEHRTSARAMSEVSVRPKVGSNLQAQPRSKTYEDSLGCPFVKKIDKPKHESVKRQKSRLRKKRSDISRKRSVSSSSSCSSTPERNSSYTKPKFRRVIRKSKKPNESCPTINLTLIATTSSSDCELSPKKIVAPVLNREPNGYIPKPAVNPIQVQLLKAANETCFLPENIVNSTAMSKPDVLVSTKNCQLSPIVNKNLSKSSKTPKRKLTVKCKKLFTNDKSTENSLKEKQAMTEDKERVKLHTVSESHDLDRKILVYTPENKPEDDENTSGGSFKLTEERLREAIGKKASRRFLTLNPQKFPLEFDSTSTIYYKLPKTSEKSDRSDSIDDSDEDILAIFGKEGELVEEHTPNA